ncbi:FAD-binding oxidoreductase [Compostimonas suwonensis]|uniref:FAD/FMN-containing dehydrogenase n=1 Tax=Compostimonas suwonensis TaxID=1048394 RepID=A0A2M9C3V1_9MICO|nr:FAD-binding oxidoreductase [Compostimonas suwonensis]PJJ65205.1 FAD/FMN-containing dehydrogenase [Compostimonas suwonensis]
MTDFADASRSIDTIEELQNAVDGVVYLRGEDGIVEEVAGFNTAIVNDPSIVVGAASEADVQAAVQYAAVNSLPVRILSTGHGTETPIVNGLLITTKRLDTVTIDPAARLATIGAGAQWGAVVAAAAEHGLAPLTGAASTVGVAGYTLGGGIGPLSRTFGFTADWVRGFRLVTASGTVARISADESPELFWALRGGKGGFGVVTEITLELIPLETIYGGSLFFAVDDIETVLRSWLDWTQTIPDSITTSAAIMRMPPLDVVPEPLRGRTLLTVRYAFVGDAEEGARLLEPIRSAAPVYLDFVAEMPAAAIATIHNDPGAPGPGWTRGYTLGEIDQDFLSTLLAIGGPAADIPIIMVELRKLGGAMAREPQNGGAVAGRTAGFTLFVVGVPDPGLFETVLPAVAGGIAEAVAGWMSADPITNFAGSITSEQQLDSLWPAEMSERLAADRRASDPAGMFTLIASA